MPNDDFSSRCVPIRSPLGDAARGALLYAGRLVVFRNVSAMHELIAHADRNVRDVFGVRDPTTAQFSLSPHSYQERAARLQTQFEKDSDTAALLRKTLEQTGANISQTFADRIKLRIHPHGNEYIGGRSRPTGLHRDTWGSNIYQQVNWWAPHLPGHARDNPRLLPALTGASRCQIPAPSGISTPCSNTGVRPPRSERDAYPSIPSTARGGRRVGGAPTRCSTRAMCCASRARNFTGPWPTARAVLASTSRFEPCISRISSAGAARPTSTARGHSPCTGGSRRSRVGNHWRRAAGGDRNASARC